MSVSRLSSRVMMPSRTIPCGLIASARPVPKTYTRSFASESEPPRSEAKPAQPGEMKSWAPVAAVGVGLGAVFAYLMAKPHNAPKVAHATGRNLPELTGRDYVDEKTGKRMGTHRSD